MLETLSTIAFLIMVVTWAVVQPARELLARDNGDVQIARDSAATGAAAD